MRIRLRLPWIKEGKTDLEARDRPVASGGIPVPEITMRDAHAYGGLALATVGGWQLSPTWTCVSVGLILLAMGLFLQRKAGN